MKYVLLIHQGTTPLPGSEEWDQLPDEEKQAVFAAYGAINQTPGVTPGPTVAHRHRAPPQARRSPKKPNPSCSTDSEQGNHEKPVTQAGVEDSIVRDEEHEERGQADKASQRRRNPLWQAAQQQKRNAVDRQQ